jgi:hypothetical protein
LWRGFNFRKAPVTETWNTPINGVSNEHLEATMNKIIIALMAIYFLGDPDLQYLAWLGDLKLYIVAAAIALVSMPWIAEQLDGW